MKVKCIINDDSNSFIVGGVYDLTDGKLSYENGKSYFGNCFKLESIDGLNSTLAMMGLKIEFVEVPETINLRRYLSEWSTQELLEAYEDYVSYVAHGCLLTGMSAFTSLLGEIYKSYYTILKDNLDSFKATERELLKEIAKRWYIEKGDL